MAEYAVTALVALAAGVGVGWFVERLVRGAAYQKRDEILAQAQRDAENVRKSHELAGEERTDARAHAAQARGAQRCRGGPKRRIAAGPQAAAGPVVQDQRNVAASRTRHSAVAIEPGAQERDRRRHSQARARAQSELRQD